MLIEKYNLYKQDYKNFILFIKSGNFYLCLNDDAAIMHQLFKYKLVESTNLIKIGFPIDSLNKILKELDFHEINYLVINEEIIDKQKFKKNNYAKYLINYDKYKIINSRINKINEILKSNINNSNINEIVNDIEGILCKTSS